MTPSAQITDMTERTLGLLIEQLKDAANYEGLVSAVTDILQEQEDSANDLLTLRDINNAVGEQLDGLGTILGESRGGRSDADYRAALLLRIFINASQADPETIIRAVEWVTLSDVVVYTESYPAGIVISFNGTPPLNATTTLNQVVAAGINLLALIAGFGAANSEMLTFKDVDAAGNPVYVNTTGLPPGLDYGYELRLSTGADDYLVFDDGSALLLSRYDVYGAATPGKLAEGLT